MAFVASIDYGRTVGSGRVTRSQVISNGYNKGELGKCISFDFQNRLDSTERADPFRLEIEIVMDVLQSHVEGTFNVLMTFHEIEENVQRRYTDLGKDSKEDIRFRVSNADNKKPKKRKLRVL